MEEMEQQKTVARDETTVVWLGRPSVYPMIGLNKTEMCQTKAVTPDEPTRR
jgi:hypothetical protein